ncbi:hypothetical protein [Fictibacillus sp. NRS-1165]|uniref:hypothetical protein n=1 Tax=Fictibacillus sp. NRS-1165 TaxID=3144463 RepID=UPI003D1E02B8
MAKTKFDNIQESLNNHDKQLQEIIKEIKGTPDGKSFITKDEMSSMLADHFKEVKDLMDTYMKQREQNKTSPIELARDLNNKLHDTLDKFIDKIQDKIQEIKDAFTDRKDHIKDSISDVKNLAQMKVRESVLEITDKMRDFTQKIDNKLEQKDSTLPKDIKDGFEKAYNAKILGGFDVKYGQDTVHIVIAKDKTKNEFAVAGIDPKNDSIEYKGGFADPRKALSFANQAKLTKDEIQKDVGMELTI